MQRSRYDAIVLGVGGIGSATVAELAARGADVLGLERFDVPHEYGSSHGTARMVRLADADHPEQVPLLERSLEHWDALEDEHDRRLRYRTGTLDIGPTEGDLLEGARRACEDHDLAYEEISEEELRERYPAFSLPEGYAGLFQPDGGVLRPGQCTVAHVERAHEAGATIRARERVTAWRATDDGVRVETDHDDYDADRLVVTAGPWAADFLDPLEGVAVPERQVLAWLQPEVPAHFEPDSLPPFHLEVPDERYYGFPVLEVPGFQFGRHHHRERAVHPDEFERHPLPADERLLRGFAEEYAPDGAGEVMRMRTCLYTNTPDGNFVVDRLAEHSQVVVGAGFSGRGFAFAPVLAEMLADLALEGESEYDLEPFSLERF